MFVAQRDNLNPSPVGATYHPGFLRYVAPPELRGCGAPRPTNMSYLRHCFKKDRNRAICRAPGAASCSSSRPPFSIFLFLFPISHPLSAISHPLSLNHPVWDRLGVVEGGQHGFGGHPGHGRPGLDRGAAQVRRQHHAGMDQQTGMHLRLPFEHV